MTKGENFGLLGGTGSKTRAIRAKSAAKIELLNWHFAITPLRRSPRVLTVTK